jgi:predicted RNA binding protein YcfA (HicA-like mRNA interferase family)
MPPGLPVINGREVVRVFEFYGWQVARQNGSHIVMVKDRELASLSIPITAKSRRGRCEASSGRQD